MSAAARSRGGPLLGLGSSWGLGFALWVACVATAADVPWKEPAWREAGGGIVTLRFQFKPGETERFQVQEQATVKTGEQTFETRLSLLRAIEVQKVSERGAAVALSAKDAIYRAGEMDLTWRLPTWGRYTISPTGQMEDVAGLVGELSIPTLPDKGVRLGNTWQAPIAFRGQLEAPDVAAKGTATYTLAGLAEVEGHTWAKLTFTGQVELPRTSITRKQIGVRPDRNARPTVQGAPVGEVLPGSSAETAGLQPGDIVVELGGMPVRSWGELLHAVAASPADRESPIAILRKGERKTLSLIPHAEPMAQVEATGTVSGMAVVDATAGVLVRREIGPLAVQMSGQAGEEKFERTLTVRSVLQRVPEGMDLTDEGAIRALVAKINQAWRDGNAALFQEILSDKAYAFAMVQPGNPNAAAILNKEAFCRGLAWFLQNRRPKKHEHEIQNITVVGPLAYEVGRSIHVSPEGRETRDETLNVFAKDDTGWKLIFSTPCANVRAALQPPDTDEKTVRKLALEHVAAFSFEKTTPRERLAAIWADDLVMAWSDGTVVEGKAAFLERYDAEIAQIRQLFDTLTVRYDISSVRLLGASATLFGKLLLTGTLKEGAKPFRREVWETLVLRRTADGWRLIQEHSNRAVHPERQGPE